MNIGVDIDGVLRDFGRSLIRVYQKHNPDANITPLHKWDKYPLHGYFPSGRKIYDFFKVEQPRDVYLGARPYMGAKEFMDKLKKDHTVTIISSQPNKEAEDLTVKWLTSHQLGTGRLVFTDDKSKIPQDIILDDCTDNLEAITAKGSGLAVAMSRPWNWDWKHLRVRDYEQFEQLVKGYDYTRNG